MKKFLLFSVLFFATACETDAERCHKMIYRFCAMRLEREVPAAVIKERGAENMINGCADRMSTAKEVMGMTDAECLARLNQMMSQE